jgi:hypothetical protein
MPGACGTTLQARVENPCHAAQPVARVFNGFQPVLTTPDENVVASPPVSYPMSGFADGRGLPAAGRRQCL